LELMAQILVLYNAPADPAAFQHYYHQIHTPLAKTIPGLRSLTISDGTVQALAGNPPYLVANLAFDSMADLQAALASPEGKATAADLQNFASGGATLLIYETIAAK
jgi:uncharacterized protein (TIGR02118 family)